MFTLQGYGKSRTCVAQLPEATETFVMVNSVRKMAVKKPCKYGEHGSFEHLFLSMYSVCFIPISSFYLSIDLHYLQKASST